MCLAVNELFADLGIYSLYAATPHLSTAREQGTSYSLCDKTAGEQL